MTLESDVVPRPQLYDIASSVFAQKLAQVRASARFRWAEARFPRFASK